MSRSRRRYEDPTHTQTLAKAYARRLRGGFSGINTVIREWVEMDDRLELEAGGSGSVMLTAEPPHPNPRNFEFSTDSQKAAAFEQWLTDAQESDVLEVIGRDENRYVRRAYRSGVERADSDLAAAGIDTGDIPPNLGNVPVHADRLQQLYTRNYENLEDITEDVADEVREVMSAGFAEGVNPRVMGRRIRDRVEKVGMHRATVLARTETINAHNEGALDRYEQILGPDAEVAIEAEVMSALDDRTCAICESYNGERMSLKEARGADGPIYHPQCRCTIRSVVNTEAQERLEEQRDLAQQAYELRRDTELSPAERSLRIGEAIEDQTGIPTSGFADIQDNRAEAIAKAINQLDAAGDLDDLEGMSLHIRAQLSNTDAIAEFDWTSQSLRFSRDRFDANLIGEAIEDGWLVGDPSNPYRTTVIHEIGHAKHRANIVREASEDRLHNIRVGIGRTELTGGEKALMREHVSDYSAENPFEVVAEVYAGRKQGAEYPQEVMDLYTRFGGPPVEPLKELTGSARKGYSRHMTANDNTENNGEESEPELPDWLTDEAELVERSAREWLRQFDREREN